MKISSSSITIFMYVSLNFHLKPTEPNYYGSIAGLSIREDMRQYFIASIIKLSRFEYHVGKKFIGNNFSLFE